jgi:predicted 2-oxoglutarate/Fe(II)-dependent dioxygenase YbiX
VTGTGIFDAPLAVERNAACFCGSGQRFKRCCGSADAQRRVPWGIELAPGFVDAATCATWVAQLEGQPRQWLDGFDHERSTPEQVVRRFDPSRVTEKVDPGTLQPALDELVGRAFGAWLAPRWNCRFEWFEQPQVLRYGAGGLYKAHADADAVDDEGRPTRVLDRDGSLLIYLNDGFTGGELEFTNFEFRLRPRPGLLAAFPSDERYTHTALPTLSGVRYAIVSWAHAQGRPRVRKHPPQHCIMLAG